jgi:hypothetical protein
VTSSSLSIGTMILYILWPNHWHKLVKQLSNNRRAADVAKLKAEVKKHSLSSRRNKTAWDIFRQKNKKKLGELSQGIETTIHRSHTWKNSFQVSTMVVSGGSW